MHRSLRQSFICCGLIFVVSSTPRNPRKFIHHEIFYAYGISFLDDEHLPFILRLHSQPHFVDSNPLVVSQLTLTHKDIIREANMVAIYMLSIYYEDFKMMF